MLVLFSRRPAAHDVSSPFVCCVALKSRVAPAAICYTAQMPGLAWVAEMLGFVLASCELGFKFQVFYESCAVFRFVFLFNRLLFCRSGVNCRLDYYDSDEDANRSFIWGECVF